MKKRYAFLLGGLCAMQISSAYAANIPTVDDVSDVILEYASQYPYKEGDEEKTLSYGEKLISGFETREDGIKYESPAVYNDFAAMLVNDYDLKFGDMSLLINGNRSVYGNKCVLYNGTTLVPAEVFDEMGCEVEYIEKFYVTRLTKNDTSLEIIPYVVGMRKNQAEGYYIPLAACARYVNDELYVPVRAAAEELGFNVGWDGETNSVVINS